MCPSGIPSAILSDKTTYVSSGKVVVCHVRCFGGYEFILLQEVREMSSRKYSKYYFQLDDTVKGRYVTKMNRIGPNVDDPYTLSLAQCQTPCLKWSTQTFITILLTLQAHTPKKSSKPTRAWTPINICYLAGWVMSPLSKSQVWII